MAQKPSHLVTGLTGTSSLNTFISWISINGPGMVSEDQRKVDFLTRIIGHGQGFFFNAKA